MRHSILRAIWVTLLSTLPATCGAAEHAAAEAARPIIGSDVVFAEQRGLLVIEAEHFFEQTLTQQRAWCLTTGDATPTATPDGDPSHIAGASAGAYLELLPDTRRTHDDKLIKGENFSNEPGRMAVLSYKVHFDTPGTYHLWARAYTTTTEDNGLHFGIDGTWPPTAQRWQTTTKGRWHWESKQRTEQVHTGVPGILTLQVERPGPHTIHVSMREDGIELDKILLVNQKDYRPQGAGPAPQLASGTLPTAFPTVTAAVDQQPQAGPADAAAGVNQPRGPDGSGEVTVTGEQKQWHKITLTLDGPFASEADQQPNPFTDHNLTITFTHQSGTPRYVVPGYFAADGDAAETGASSGTKWRAHLTPDKPGRWDYAVSFTTGPQAALDGGGSALAPFHGRTGSFSVTATDKHGRDFRAHGRLQYVGEHHLRFAGSQQYFLKAGADAPETLLAYADFDDTVAGKPERVPLKTWSPHVRDWQPDDPTWQDGKGKGLIGALNYLSNKGANAFSFLTYNAGGDGDNVWPFTARDAKLHYDCSKLDQWDIVFDHATTRGLYLHFKMQETENDDNRPGTQGVGDVPTSLDGGKLGPQRKLYCRELIARFAHHLALNWNLGEENTQSTDEINDMINYIRSLDPYQHHVVVHTYPNQQDKVYEPLLGDRSQLSGLSLQNSNVRDTHVQVVKWVARSAQAGRPWVVAFDEPGDATFGMPPDEDWPGMRQLRASGAADGAPTVDDIRKYVLWGALLARGGGVEYYFGYKLPENDLVCQDWRSRDQSWDYCRIALDFFRDHKIPFHRMVAADPLVGNPASDNSRYCFAATGELYLVYLPEGGTCDLDLREAAGKRLTVQWFNPRAGGPLQSGTVRQLAGGARVGIGEPPASTSGDDWLAVIRAVGP